MSPRPFTLLFCLLLCTCVRAQFCTGNLGENIFEEGDFGSGTATIVQNNPMIAPGFAYQTNPPPNDGFYTITNDMRAWNSVFPAWDQFADNSNDPDGYMMVVNAAFEPGLFYEQEVSGLCENTEYQFTADIRNIMMTGTNGIRPNVSFLINGVVQFTTGDVPDNQRWNTYGFSFNTAPGETTITLALENNAPGGFGNDLALDNITFQACGPEARILGAETLSICEDGNPAGLLTDIIGEQYDDPAYQWQQSFDEGETWVDLPGENDQTYLHTNLSSGFYYYRYLLANGAANLTNSKCRVNSNVKIVYVVPKRWEIVDTICAGLSFTVGSSTYTSTGVTVDSLISSLGCDSIVTLDLTVVPDPGLEPVFDLRDPSCSYLTDGSLQLLSVTGAVPPVRGTVGDSVGGGNPFLPLSGLGEGSYGYSLTDRYGCTVSGSVELTTPNPFTLELGEDRTIDLGESVRILVEGSDTIAALSFTPAEGIDCPLPCERLDLTPPRSVLLSATATSNAGCLATDSLRIDVIRNYRTYFANAFSPNGDGINDSFTLQAAAPTVRLVEQLEVYNRWGGAVFTGTDLLPNDMATGWNGRNNSGEAQPTGLYTYVARVRFLDDEVRTLRGSVVLVR